MRDKKEYYRDYYQMVAKPRLRKRYERPCPICDELLYTRGANLCKSCAHKGKTGQDASHWKGGKILSREYVYVYNPQHPRADKRNYVPEHILVWEETHKQSLPPNWVIHHINGIKSDNRPENLLGLPYQKHHIFWVQKALQGRIRELEAQLNIHCSPP